MNGTYPAKTWAACAEAADADRLTPGLARTSQRCLAVFIIDLDGFKRINDRHGHGVGNALLQITAIRFRHAVRTHDLVGRIGGDEFACVVDRLPGRAQVRHVACKLFAAICAPMELEGQLFAIRPSIGISLYPSDASCPATLLASADQAMYVAKRRRLGYSFFDTFPAGITVQGAAQIPSCHSKD